ncbi:MAG: FMN-dependent NADH-azoreductase [Bacillota bacterium]
MATLLYVQANPKPVEFSKSLTVAREFMSAYKEAHPEDKIATVDVYNGNVPLLDWDCIQAKFKPPQVPLTETEQKKLAALDTYADQFVAADKYVFVTPLWNLGLPPMMKAYIDAIMAVGKTFRYTEKGPVGLLQNKKAVHIHSRGGIYSVPPMNELDFGDRYIQTVFRFIGVSEVHSIICEGHEYMPDKAGDILNAAITQARELARTF